VKPLDSLFLARANELAAHGIGNTAPNPPVGAVLVRHGEIIGEGYHHRAGAPHAEIEALKATKAIDSKAASGATLYVSLEPCNHAGRTPPCTQSIIDAGISRVVIGAIDPNPRTNGSGIQRLREAGITVELANDATSAILIEIFSHAMQNQRPYLALKLAMSLDGFITSKPGVQEWLTSEEERLYVRNLRIMHDAIMVGAGTIRIDDPQLTVRPSHNRLRPYYRIVLCETGTVSETSRIFETVENYERTIIITRSSAPKLEKVAEVIVAEDLTAALQALYESGIQSILCEGGPTLGARLIEAKLVDRFYWAIAPKLLANKDAVPVLTGVDLAALQRELHFDHIEQTGDDIILSGIFLENRS